MPKIKQSLVNSNTMFNLNGLDYKKGIWETFYLNKEINPTTLDVNLNKISIGVRSQTDQTNVLQHPVEIVGWLDGTNTPYNNLDTLTSDLSDLLGFDNGGGVGSAITVTQQVVNYAALIDGDNVGELAYAENSQGTSWLPSSMGGIYYPSGFYLWDGVIWVSDRNAIANQLEQTIINLNNKVNSSDISNLLTQEFTFSGSQTFTLANNYGDVHSVSVQGQGLSLSQYTKIPPNQITINDTLNTGDYVIVNYSNAIVGLQPYFSQAETTVLLDNKLDKITNYKFVCVKSDFPIFNTGVSLLEDDTTYFIVCSIDLLGDRLVGGSNTTIIGSSSEVSILTSTGLGVGVPLLTSIYTTPIRNIAINDVDTALSFDGSTNPNDLALDFTGVNFVNIPNIGTIKKASNFIFDKGALINSKGLKFDGTIGTVALNNSIYIGDGNIGNIIEILPTCVITRRFRITYSSLVTFGSTVGVNVDILATIPIESYILDTVNFSGGGTYQNGVSVLDNKTDFIKCKGIQNSAEVSQYYMNNNLTTTVIAVVDTAVKVLGTTTSSSISQKFTNTNNRATYVGSLTKIFKVSATLSIESGNNNQVGVYISKNGTLINESEVYGTTSGSGRGENIKVHTLVELSTNDYIEIWVENATAANNILITSLNTIIE